MNPSTQFSNFFNAYAKAINKAYGRTGSLFQHPFGRVPVIDSAQFFRVVIYIHQNPQKHGFVKDFRKWKYSSYGVLLSEQPARLAGGQVMDWFGARANFEALHQSWDAGGKSTSFALDDD